MCIESGLLHLLVGYEGSSSISGRPCFCNALERRLSTAMRIAENAMVSIVLRAT